jgi:hypothetical protein
MEAYVALTAISTLAGAASASANSKSMANEAEAQSRLAETQALQRDTASREELDVFLSGLQASRAANGLSSRSPNAILLESKNRNASDHNRLVQRADDRQRAANFRTSAQNHRRKANFSIMTGIAKAGVPLAEYGSYKGWGS